MMLLSEGTGFQGDGGAILGPGAGTRSAAELVFVQSYPLVENELVRAVWDGTDLRVYIDGPAIWLVGEPVLQPGGTDPAGYVAGRADEATALSTEATIAALHDVSGLTWDQIARALAVSKRTVLLWARGGRVSNKNHELVLSLKQLVDSIPGTPEQRRNALLAASPTEASALTRWVRENVLGQPRVNAPAASAHQLLG